MEQAFFGPMLSDGEEESLKNMLQFTWSGVEEPESEPRSTRQQGLGHNMHRGISQHRLTRGLWVLSLGWGPGVLCCSLNVNMLLDWWEFTVASFSQVFSQFGSAAAPIRNLHLLRLHSLNVNRQAKPTANLRITQVIPNDYRRCGRHRIDHWNKE